MRNRYFIIEDREDKSGYTFWRDFLKALFPDIVLMSGGNSSELVKFVGKIQESDDEYYIVLDDSFDNQQTTMEWARVTRIARNMKNVHLIDFACFEYILLQFQELDSWVFAEEDELKQKRRDLLMVRENFLHAVDKGIGVNGSIYEIHQYAVKWNCHNIEQFSAKLLFDITRNTGFEVSKSKLGPCWHISCCEWDDRQEDDICGLDKRRIDLTEKMRQIYRETSIRKEFIKNGIEDSI